MIPNGERIKKIRDAMARSAYALPSGLLWLVVCEACWQDFNEPCHPILNGNAPHLHKHHHPRTPSVAITPEEL